MQTASLSIGAQINASCTLDVVTQVSFGTVDLTAPAPTDAIGTFTLDCSSGAPVYITLGQGTNPAAGSSDAAPMRQMSAGATDRLAYQLYRNAAYTQLWGNTQPTAAVLLGSGAAQSVAIYGRVAPGQAVVSGAYQDTVLATVTY
ncbi:MAG TPA: spore coat U domain-containing protein [Polyangiales bacterium]